MQIKKKCKVNNCEHECRGNGLYCAKHEFHIRKHGKILNRTIYDPNEFIVEGDIAYMLIYDRNCKVKARIVIDASDVDLCKQYKWCLNKKQTVLTNVTVNGKRKSIYLYRLLMGVADSPHTVQVDHISRDRLDNRKANLRICSPNQNSCNSKLRSTNTTGYRGVVFRKDTEKYQAQIWHKNKRISLGCYDTALEAAQIYNEAAEKYHKEYSSLNNVV